MEISKKALVTVIVASALVSALMSYSIGMFLRHTHITYLSTVGIELERWSVHSQIQFWKGDKLILDEYNAGVVTDVGDNATLMWIFGDPDYNVSQYLYNATYISIGNQGSLSTASQVLPGEWNRTVGTVEDENQSWLNITCTIYPDDSGPYTADCIGLNWRSSIGNYGNLWAYDIFTEVTGIDETFTINIEFKISVAHT